MRIQHSYLMWVGADNYETISEYIDEVRRLGVSKRLPGFGMANALQAQGALVYVAHDDGEAYSCDACMGQVECSECRTWSQKIAKWQGEADAVRNRYEDDEETPRGKARIIEIREARIANARAAMAKCELCEGEGAFECGTGGYVVRSDRSRMDYRTYNYWMRQPHKFDVAREVTEKHMCEECGGTGKRPAALVFGAFVPEIEVVVSGREHEIVREQIEKFAKRVSLAAVAKEPERKGGRREPGYYAVAKSGKPSKGAIAVARELVTLRAVKGEPEVLGDFVLFGKPVKVDALKRFRGVKRFSLVKVDAEGFRAELGA
jgi:hypothetical protein